MSGSDIRLASESIFSELSKFSNFDFKNVSSWSELELYATVMGIDNMNSVICVLIIGSRDYLALYNAICDAISDPERGFNITSELIECVFRTYSEDGGQKSGISLSVNDAMTWTSFAVKFIPDYTQVWLSKDERKKRKYRLLSAIVSVYPVAFAKFYDKYKQKLRLTVDSVFMCWLNKIYAELAKKDAVCRKIYSILSSDLKQQINSNMFLS